MIVFAMLLASLLAALLAAQLTSQLVAVEVSASRGATLLQSKVASIRTALGKLRPSSDTLPMYYSALARSRADWLVGMNLSRLFTVLGRQAGYDGVLSVGRVHIYDHCIAAEFTVLCCGGLAQAASSNSFVARC